MRSYRKVLVVLFTLATLACQNEKPPTPSKTEISDDSLSQNNLVSLYQAALRKSATDSIALVKLSKHYLSQDQPEKALPLLKKQRENGPSYALDSCLLAVYQQLNLYAEAAELMPSICRDRPTLENHFLHAQLLQKAGKNEESNQLIDSILPFSQQKSTLLALKGINFLVLEDTAAACVSLAESKAKGQQLNDSLFQLLCLPNNKKLD